MFCPTVVSVGFVESVQEVFCLELLFKSEEILEQESVVN